MIDNMHLFGLRLTLGSLRGPFQPHPIVSPFVRACRSASHRVPIRYLEWFPALDRGGFRYARLHSFIMFSLVISGDETVSKLMRDRRSYPPEHFAASSLKIKWLGYT
jgi:hypothetical protein